MWRKGRGGGGRVGDEKGDGSPVINLGGAREEENTVRIPEDSGSNVGKGGSNQGRWWVFGGERMRGIESFFGGTERPRYLDHMGEVVG